MTSPLRYNPAFDGLRAIAALCVIASHCELPGLAGGFYGVDLFFVLSGFLITWLLFDEHSVTGRIDLPYFFFRRYLRLTPPLLAMLAVYLAIAPTAWPEFSLWSHIRDVLLTGSYVSDYARAFWGTPLILQHSWSLGVEEHFYLLWPLAVLALLRLPARWRPAALFCLYIAATAWRMAWYRDETTWPETYYRFDTAHERPHPRRAAGDGARPDRARAATARQYRRHVGERRAYPVAASRTLARARTRSNGP